MREEERDAVDRLQALTLSTGKRTNVKTIV